MERQHHTCIDTGRQIGLLLLALAMTSGCSRQMGSISANRSPSNGGQLPFDRISEHSGISPTHALLPTSVPVGTPLVIRLKSSLSSARCRVGDVFQSMLDEPVVIQGQTLVPLGALVSGRVVAAKAHDSTHEPGYLRLTLAALVIKGTPLQLHTSSVFAKGSSSEHGKTAENAAPSGSAQTRIVVADAGAGMRTGSTPRHADATFSTDRQLTFRLVQPLLLPQ